jgi:hypothetical protein
MYVQDATGNRPLIPCGEDRQTRTRLRSFGSDFAWSSEHASYDVPRRGCPAKTPVLEGVDRSVFVVHHGRLLMVNSGTSVTGNPGASFAQLEQLAHKAVRRF